MMCVLVGFLVDFDDFCGWLFDVEVFIEVFVWIMCDIIGLLE